MKDYAEHKQAAAPNNYGRGAQKGHRSPAASPRAALSASLDTVLQALRYEDQCGYTNFVGLSGERFDQWTVAQLHAAALELSSQGLGDVAQECASLGAEFAGYSGTASEPARTELIFKAAAAVKRMMHALVEQPHPSRYVAMSPGGHAATPPAVSAPPATQPAVVRRSLPEDMDAVAEAAHMEETAPGVSSGSSGAGEAASHLQQAATEAGGIGATSPEDDDGYVQYNGRRVKASTLAFRRSFAEAALQATNSGPTAEEMASGEQRTDAWLALRERRLTASAFSKALGFFEGDRLGLWEEKVGLKEPFSGNEATRWGTRSEPLALSAYEQLAGNSVDGCMFKLKHNDAPHGWLGASPDGLIGSLGVHHPSGQPVEADAAAAAALGPGILEIKCPYNKGRPDLAVPPERAIWYYMPQLQGLMDIFNREWCTLFVWTPDHGSASFMVRRNRSYWAACFDVLAEFWWAHTVPARQARERGAALEEIEAFRPSQLHAMSMELKAWSKRLAAEAPVTRYPPLPKPASRAHS